MKKLLITVLGCFILATAYPQDIIILKSGHDYRRHEDLIQEVNRLIGKFIS